MTLKKGQYWRLKNGKVIYIVARNPVAYTRGNYSYKAGVIINCYGYDEREDVCMTSFPEQDVISLIKEQDGVEVSGLEYVKRKIV